MALFSGSVQWFFSTFNVSTNTYLALKKPRWIECNAGRLIEDQTFEQALVEFTDKIVSTINGELTQNEFNNSREIAIWKTALLFKIIGR